MPRLDQARIQFGAKTIWSFLTFQAEHFEVSEHLASRLWRSAHIEYMYANTLILQLSREQSLSGLRLSEVSQTFSDLLWSQNRNVGNEGPQVTSFDPKIIMLLTWDPDWPFRCLYFIFFKLFVCQILRFYPNRSTLGEGQSGNKQKRHKHTLFVTDGGSQLTF